MDIIENISDTELAKAIFAKAETSLESGLELMKLAEAALTNLEDKEYGRALYQKAQEKLGSGDELMKLA